MVGVGYTVPMMPPFAYEQSVALVTGASRGIGAEIARVLADRGIATLVLTARAQADLDELARELKAARPSLRVETIVADLSQPDAAQVVWSETVKRGLSVDLLVNNAGFGSVGYFDSSPLQKEADMVAVNVSALVQLSRLFMPALLAKKRGGIINVASTAAFQPVPFMATYGATKAFVLSFSEALWAEARERGPECDVRIVCLCPGSTESHFADGLGAERGKFENVPQATGCEVAEAACRALDKAASFHVVGRANYFSTFGARILPRSTMARFTARIFRPASPTDDQTAALQKRHIVAGAALVVSLVGAGVALALHQQRKKG